MEKYYFGIDIGGTELKFGMFDGTKKLVKTLRKQTPTENVRFELAEIIYVVVNEMLNEQGADVQQLGGIGITVPGPVARGIVIFCSNIDMGRNFDIVSAVKHRFGIASLPVVVGNDANLAAYGEYRNLNNSYIRNLVFVTLGTGIGGGIIVDGKILEGVSGSSGEIGHIPYVYGKNRVCGCGQKDCIESVAGTFGMIQTAKELMVKEKSSMENLEITPKVIFDHAKAGDLVALQVADSVAQAIAMMAVTISVIVDPEVYLIGGGVSKAGDFLIQKINYHYQQHARFDTSAARFELARLGNDAGFYGAFYYLLDNL